MSQTDVWMVGVVLFGFVFYLIAFYCRLTFSRGRSDTVDP